jgi:hypothetical protein
MPNVTLPAKPQDGALIWIAIGLSRPQAEARSAAGLSEIHPAVVSALIDTGASMTLIDDVLARRLELNRTGEIEVRSTAAADPAILNTYAVLLQFAQPTKASVSEALQVAGGRPPIEGVGALLGRDVLSRCVFIYNGPASQFTLSY